jgi:hypothetical protein
VDDVSVSTGGPFGASLVGTSAASAHAGAIAALLLSCKASLLHGEGGDDPAADRVALRNALLQSAVDLGAPGVDAMFGAGRLDATAAADALDCTLDSDGDGVLNVDDNCPTIANPAQTNSDNAPIVTAGAVDDTTVPLGDDLGDACDHDNDNDGIDNDDEAAGCNGSGALNAMLFDSDGDRAGDGAECVLGTNPSSFASKPEAALAPGVDPDRDGLDAARVFALGSNANDADSDDDGIGDGIEFRGYHTSPTMTDSDGDGCADGVEIASLNGDANVNSLELSLVAQRFGLATAPNMDVNKDGDINAIDLSLVAQNFVSVDC